jgi:hypothetical protein
MVLCSSLPHLGRAKCFPIYAIRGPNVSSEIAALSVLHTLTADSCPLAPILMAGAAGQRDFQQCPSARTAVASTPLSIAAALAGLGDDDGGIGGGATGSAGTPSLDPLTFHLHMSTMEMNDVLQDVVEKFHLNDDQVRCYSILLCRALLNNLLGSDSTCRLLVTPQLP